MPAGKFSRAEVAHALRGIDESIARGHARETKLQVALKLIKAHITEAQTAQNEDLHQAIGLIVDVARYHGYLTR